MVTGAEGSGYWVEMGSEGSGWRWGLRAVGGDGD